ncbi:hypothetical protein QCA50_000310 [Cerrena zonata]|uniref:Uncharacterized protein n=1 Tax=Cerrena zonata TaxID=2478898 RepID=A0AAW0GWD0_9APHY
MASVLNFPHADHHSAASSSSTHDLNDSYFSSSFEPPNASFQIQMNPLSSHPPRTPRTSVTSSSVKFGSEIYTSQEIADEAHIELNEDAETDDEDEKTREEAMNRIPKEVVWQDLLTTANGRDKAFKLMQYSLRMYLLFHSSAASLGNKARPGWEAALFKRFESTISGFSLTRKCLILFNWLAPLNHILADNSADPSDPLTPLTPTSSKPNSNKKPIRKHLLHTFLHTSPPVLLELVNGVSDDIATFSKLGLIGRKTGDRAGKFADWCWFVGTLVNLVENSVERGVILDLQHQVESRLYSESMTGATTKSNPSANRVDHKELERLQRQDYWIQVTRMKLLMDLIFVSYNVFRLKRAKSSIQTFTGLASAALSTAKLYDRHKTSIVKAAKFA